jgi:catechol 2,3-dioxygenase-like lactoylglutathione lyase family enzyme
MQESLRFYRDLCGFDVVSAGVQESDFTYEETMEGRPPKRHVVMLNIGKGSARTFLTLTEYPGTEVTGTSIKLDQVGITHVSFVLGPSQSLADFAERALAMGFEPCGDQERFRDPDGVVRMLFFYDPDGVLVQFDHEIEWRSGESYQGGYIRGMEPDSSYLPA